MTNNKDEDGETFSFCQRFGLPALAACTTVFVALGGWGLSIEARLQKALTITDERGPRIDNLEIAVRDLNVLARAPESKPETKVAIDGIIAELRRHDAIINKIEDRINNRK